MTEVPTNAPGSGSAAADRAAPPRSTGRLVAGAILLFLGALFLLDNFGILDAGDVFHYWPLILVGIGLTRLLAPCRPQERIGGIVTLIVGLAFLLRAFGVPWFRLRMVWPALLVAVGVALIWQALRGSRGPLRSFSEIGDRARLGAMAGLDAVRSLGPDPSEASSVLKEFALMGGGDRIVRSQDFRGGEVTAIMGGFQIDLRAAGMAGDTATIEVFTLFGGVEFKVPQSWNVVVSGTPILGMVSNTTSPIRDESAAAKTLVVRGAAIMGGIEVKN
jgi:predicted membrane protein